MDILPTFFLRADSATINKAKAFMQADNEYYEKTGCSLFAGVGIGEIIPGIFATADIFEISGIPFAKTGREFIFDDFRYMKKVV